MIFFFFFQVEEVKKAKAELLKQRSAGALPSPHSAPLEPNAAAAGAVNDEPDWQSELSSWKTRRRKQSEETLMRVAEIKALEDADGGAMERKVSLNKKLSGLLQHDDGFDWEDLGLEREPKDARAAGAKSRSVSRSPENHPAPAAQQQHAALSPIKEPDAEEDAPLDFSAARRNFDQQADSNGRESADRGGEPLERWTSSSSLHGAAKEPVRAGEKISGEDTKLLVEKRMTNFKKQIKIWPFRSRTGTHDYVPKNSLGTIKTR